MGWVCKGNIGTQREGRKGVSLPSCAEELRRKGELERSLLEGIKGHGTDRNPRWTGR